MICRKCNKFVDNSESVCPHCGAIFIKKSHSSNNGAVNKYIQGNSANLVGGTVTKATLTDAKDYVAVAQKAYNTATK